VSKAAVPAAVARLGAGGQAMTLHESGPVESIVVVDEGVTT